MNNINIFTNKGIWVITCFMFLLAIGNSQISKINLYSGIEVAFLPYNSLAGIKFSASLEKEIDRSFLLLNSNLIYAIGNRDFNYKLTNRYTLVDGNNRTDYPLPGIIPGLYESAYIMALKLQTAKTVDIGLSAMYGRSVLYLRNSNLKAAIGLHFSWVEETSIAYDANGNFTNIFGTGNDIYLVMPYSQNYFDLGPQFGLIYNFNITKSSSFGLLSNVTWLIYTGINYSLGPFFRIQL